MKVSRRTYRALHWLGFMLPLAVVVMIWVSPMQSEWYGKLAIVMALLAAAVGAADFVRAWRETER